MKFRVSIPGAFSRFSELMKLGIFKWAKVFDVSVYDGLASSPWNSGRINSLCSLPDEDYSRKLAKIYNSKGIGVFITFSNYRIDDLDRVIENRFLSALNESRLNGVILVNPELRDWVRKHYPHLKISYSVSGFSNVDLSNIQTIFQNHDLICPRYEWVFNPEFLREFDISKCNVMLNDCCKENCRLWGAHFKAISDANRLGIQDQTEARKVQECWIATESCNPRVGWGHGEDIGMNLSIDGVRRLVELGYCGFKICGRDLPAKEFNEEIKTYMEYLCSLR